MKKKSQKQQIKKRLLKVFLIILSLATIYSFVAPKFLNPNTAYAVGDLNVVWGVPDGAPIFVVANTLPGDVETRSVDVVNSASSARPVAVRGIEQGGDTLKDVLEIVISEGATDLYGGTLGTKTLAQFFIDSSGPDGIPLSTLAPLASTTYVFEVTFPASAGNEFQGKSAIFDLIIGISAEISGNCDQIDLLPTPIIGTSAAETLNGTPGNDLIMGLEGADKINGNGGDDCIFGGEGADKINGNDGNDVIFGEGGGDSINGNNGDDTIDGGVGGDTINGENGDDFIIGGSGGDTIKGGAGNDQLFGNEDSDSIKGGEGDDYIEGGSASDSLDGENGEDQVLGQDGPDTLKGGNGDDILDGGPGVDTANGNAGTDTCDAETETNCEI